MAKRVEILLDDDVDGGAADETVRFGLDGNNYEIDLSSANAAKLRATVDPWRTHARKARRGRKVGRRVDLGASPQVVRAWAQSHGYKLSNRGRVPAAIQEEYAKANPGG